MSDKPENKPPATKVVEEDNDDEPDEWDKRIFSTGCAGKSMLRTNKGAIEETNAKQNEEENSKMTDCYFEKKDWRLCKAELETFKTCWKKHQNDQRISTKDA